MGVQDLLPQEKVAEYIKEAKQSELDAADEALWMRHAEELEDDVAAAAEAAST